VYKRAVETATDWQALFERERARVEDGEARGDPEQLVRIGNAAYGAGLSLLMLGRTQEANAWLGRAATRWRESWEHATPTSWGRPIGAIKASLIAGHKVEARRYARWALELGTETAESPIGRYAASLALLTLARWPDARIVAATIRGRDDFPHDVADALWSIAANDAPGYAAAVGSVVRSFETREEYLEDVPVADTALALVPLAERRGVGVALPPSPTLPRAFAT
jgi:hypothetical protein